MLQLITIFFLVFKSIISAVEPNKYSSNVSSQNENQPGCEFLIQKFPVPAKFPGGTNAWKKFLEKNIHYPQMAIDQNAGGVIRLQMCVEVNGNITDVEALNDQCCGLAEEAERVIKASPKWKPALKDNKPVRYRFIQTITFSLQD